MIRRLYLLSAFATAATLMPGALYALGCEDEVTLTSSADYDPAGVPIPGTLRHALEVELEYCANAEHPPTIYIPTGLGTITLQEQIFVTATYYDDMGELLHPRVRIIGAVPDPRGFQAISRITAPPGTNHQLLVFVNAHVYIQHVHLENGQRAIVSQGGDLEVADCRFSGHNGGAGGAIFFSGSKAGWRLIVSRSAFVDNEADSGAAVYAVSPGNGVAADVFIEDSYFSNNVGQGVEHAYLDAGGAVRVSGGIVRMANNTFENNRQHSGDDARFSAGGAVGLLHVRESQLVMNGFVDNKADRAGALAIISEDTTYAESVDYHQVFGNRFLNNTMWATGDLVGFEAFEFSPNFPLHVSLRYNAIDQGSFALPVFAPQLWHIAYNESDNLTYAGVFPLVVVDNLGDLPLRKILRIQYGMPGINFVPDYFLVKTPERDAEGDARPLPAPTPQLKDAGPDEDGYFPY